MCVTDLFNHPSNTPTDDSLLALDLSALLRANDEVLERLIPVIVMDFFAAVAINRPTKRRSHLVLDEAHALLHTEAGARTMQTIFRIGRSLQFKATVITQTLSDLDESEQPAHCWRMPRPSCSSTSTVIRMLSHAPQRSSC